MNNKFTIKNFRVFNSEGVTFELAPITMLTGCNSAGKSSLAKALLLLNSFLSQIERDVALGNPIVLNKYKIDFSKLPNSLLGRFDNVINRDSKDRTITFEYTIHSLLLSEEVTVFLQFAAQQNDELNNGYLKNFTLKNYNGEIIYSSDRDDKECFYNFNLIKQQCCNFLYVERVISIFTNIQNLDRNEEKDKNTQKEIISELKTNDKKNDVLKYIRTYNFPFDKYCRWNSEMNLDLIIEWTKQTDSFFYMPIFDECKNISKMDIRKKIENDCNVKKINEEERYWIDKVLADFEASDKDSLLEYFKNKEEDFFKMKTSSLFSSYKSPYLFERNYLMTIPIHFPVYLSNDYVTFGDDAVRDDLWEEKINAKKEREPIDFNIVYNALMAICRDDTKHEYYKPDPEQCCYIHYMYELLNIYAENVVKESLLTNIFGKTSYVSSSRVDVKRLYTLETQDDFSQLLQNYFDAKLAFANKNNNRRKKYEINSFINKWIKKFEIGDSLSLHPDEDGLGVKIRLHKQPNDKGTLLADEGYGITQFVSILLQIECSILSAKEAVCHCKYYGLSILDKYNEDEFHYEKRTIVIEEPEIHLHPKFQSLLADMFLDAYQEYNINFIVETHSEYLIRKLQTFVAKKDVEQDAISLYYLYNSDESKRPENTPQVKKIDINEDGRLNEPFGSGFFDEADNLSMNLLTIKMQSGAK